MAELKQISFNGKQLNSLTRADVEALLSSGLASFDKLDYKVADDVPTAAEVVIGGQTVPTQTGVRYLVKNDETGNYEEYILVDGVVHDIGSTADGKVEMILPVNSDPEPVEVGHIWIHTEPDYAAMSWANATDEELAFMLDEHDKGKVDLYSLSGWAVGSVRRVDLAAMTAYAPLTDIHLAQGVDLVLMDKNVVDLTDGNRCHFVWQQKDGLSNNGQIDVSTTGNGGWTNVPRRGWCNNTYYNALPSGFASLIKTAHIKTAESDSYQIAETDDKVFLPCEYNVIGSSHFSGAGEDTVQWTYYKTTGNRVKRRGLSGSDDMWWLRSPVPKYDAFCFINFDGSYMSGGATNAALLAPCGCI